MGFTLKISPKAQEDIDGIYDFIYKDSPKNALEQVRIYKAFDDIEVFPGIGAELQGYVSIPTKYKFFIVDKTYIVFYFTDKDDIFVSRVFSVKQDYLKILGIK